MVALVISVTILFLLVPKTGATIVVSSEWNPAVSGLYVRGVEHRHEKAYAKASTDGDDDDTVMDLWMYYQDLGVDGYRWYIGVDIFRDSAIAFADSWSTDPCANQFTTSGANNNHNKNNSTYQKGNMSWRVFRDNHWQIDPTFTMQCYGYDAGGTDACSSSRTKQNNAVPCVDLVGSGGGDHNVVKMPTVMLGTAYISASHGAGADNPEVVEPPPAIEMALELDYQGLDLGSQVHPAYANERAVGTMLASNKNHQSTTSKHRRRRQSVFLTTKLSPSEHGFESTLRAAQRSLRLLRTDTIDLFLIHHPTCMMVDHCEGDWTQSWRALERLLDIGAVRAIGVSNFDHHLMTQLVGDDVRETSGIARAPVSLLQNRADPLVMEDPKVLKLCKTHGINYQAFSVLGRQHVVGPWSPYWKAPHPILANPAVQAIANRLSAEETSKPKNARDNANATTATIRPAQVVLRWAIQKGWTVVPKTAKADRLEANRQLFHFHLTESDMAVLDNLQAPPPPASNEQGEL